MLRKFFEKINDEEIIDGETGDVYRHIEIDYRGNKIEINEDITGEKVGKFHAKANNNNLTTKINMDEGGVIGWLKSIFG